MLNFIELSNPSDKKKYLDSYLKDIGPGSATWVVSDLRNKFEIQQMILKDQDSFEDLSVMRANELWRFLLKRARPEIKLISRDFIRIWIRDRLRKSETKWGSQVDQVVFEMMDMMAPIHLHENGGQMMRTWFQENPESLQRWGGWFLLSEELFEELIGQKKICNQWIAPLLQAETSWESFWSRPIIFDLGANLHQAEAELILNLAKSTEVTVLAPIEKLQKEYDFLFKPYVDLYGKSKKGDSSKAKVDSAEIKTGNSVTVEVSGILAECKMACEMIRQWLDQNTPPDQIAVIAPDIESYWPILEPILRAEGIPLNKDSVVRLQTLPSVAQWVSEIKIGANEIKYSDLEQTVYSNAKPTLRFEEFYSLYKELLDPTDLKRSQAIYQGFQSRFSATQEISLDEFLGYSLSCWKDSQTLALEISLRELMTNSDMSQNLTVSSWIQLLQQVVSKKEIKIEKAEQQGIQLANLTAADSLLVTHRIFLGLSETQLKGRKSSLLMPKEVTSISSTLGFYLEHPEVSQFEFDLQWQSRNPIQETVYSYPLTGFSGAAEAPSEFWLALSMGKNIGLTQPSKSRWDQVLNCEASSILMDEYHWEKVQIQEGLVRSQVDQGLAPLPTIELKRKISLSASSIESYRECPFIFAAQKVLRLKDLPLFDLDVDRRTRGQLAHGVLDKISVEPRRFDWSDQELQVIINDLREPLGLLQMDEFIWNGLRERHVAMAKRYLAFENEWRKIFPETKIVGREKSFDFLWNNENRITGKIDRIDSDSSGRMAVIDYKVSPGEYKHFNGWIDKNQIQLALYMLAVEGGHVQELPASEVIGAFYYILKNMNRDGGLKVEEASGTLFTMDRKKNRISLEGKKKLLSDVTVLITETIQNLVKGEFAPKPLDLESCDTCHWRNLCRSPHLI